MQTDPVTLVAVWVRQNATLRELVLVSDSRIRGGEAWDACPKIYPLPRPAAAVAMSGDATAAYAFLLHTLATCQILDGHLAGRTDISNVAEKVRDVLADSRRLISDPPRNATIEIPNLDVVLVGWSWRRLNFQGFSYTINRNGLLVKRRLAELDEERPYGVYFFGDAAPSARRKLRKLLKERELPMPRRGQVGEEREEARKLARRCFLTWEPLEVILDIMQDPAEHTVGGAPQIIRLYQNGISESFVWRSDDEVDYFGGRRVQPNERFDRRIARFQNGSLQISMSDRRTT